MKIIVWEILLIYEYKFEKNIFLYSEFFKSNVSKFELFTLNVSLTYTLSKSYDILHTIICIKYIFSEMG